MGLGVKTEGDLVISGTRGYVYVPAPWWKTEYFEMRFESQSETEKYFYKFAGEGLRYEMVEFLERIGRGVDYPGRSLVCDFEGRVIEDAGVFDGGLGWVFDVSEVVSGVEEMRERWGLKD